MNLLLLILSAVALIAAIVSATGKCPVWVAPLLLALVACLTHFPK